ncbi:hypothetical protein BVRB_8g186260 [Beta vulgaris subsp. vulgaris]|uniref:uncharacterized protein LOC104901045 n=1 Tax=Beta vulgaris subsp. vulgaris TaxID=3555 RepID=UPI00065C345C|nr:uncharacterized protein LOC104901045 [Beta vulgaris subsp. vulgaris]KMT04178.1 hypothetical protein BVRB_8g186260 [Beta vulgaris subsp. vulgaris]
MVDMDEIVAELQRERRKNAELLQRISALEALIQHERDKGSAAPLVDDTVQNGHPNSAEERCSKKHKTQKTEDSSAAKLESIMHMKQDADVRTTKASNFENGLVSWMSVDTQSLLLDKSKDIQSLLLECEDADDSDDEDDEHSEDVNCEGLNKKCQERTKDYNKNEIDFPSISQKLEQDWEEMKKNVGFRNLSLQKKPPKVAFCPKEVRGILGSQVLGVKNAQSHTMRKIIVFASLGIRHGCDDMYELNYNHFVISKKGQPYISQSNPGEHVLYENPGMKRKVFYPNRQNPALCPVQILEEEQAMRPSDASCPPCLFLCIKYGGRTRNIPQNEYVRQRMGRNKLKSFGPLICLMARLMNVRTGSFFFKALGITLLFMAGFPDDIVQKETKYRNLDLLQKYYRTDEDAAGEELFLVNPSASQLANFDLEKPNSRTTKTSKRKKQPANCTTSNEISQKHTSEATTSTSPSLIPPDASFQTIPSSSNNMIINSQPNIIYNQHPLCPMFFPARPHNAMTPMMYWPSVIQSAYPTCPCPSTYGYRALGGIYGGHYAPIHSWPCYSHGLEARIADNSNEAANADSASSLSSTENK